MTHQFWGLSHQNTRIPEVVREPPGKKTVCFQYQMNPFISFLAESYMFLSKNEKQQHEFKY